MQRFLRILRKDNKEFLINLDLITGVFCRGAAVTR